MSVDSTPVTILQRYIRGYNVRSRIISTNEVLPFLNMVESPKNIARLISATSIQMVLHPDKYLLGSRHRRYIKYSKNPFQEIVLEKPIWIGLDRKGHALRVQIHGKKLRNGHGTYKHYKFSDTLVIPFELDKKITIEKTVLGRSNESAELENIDESGLPGLLETLQFSEHFFSTKALEGIKVAEYPHSFRYYKSKKGIKLEWEEKRYLNDFFEANRSFDDFSFTSKIRIVKGIFDTLKPLHQKGYSHRDIKSANILIEKKGDSDYEGFLTDWDLITNWGYVDAMKDYPYWDICCTRGIILPTTDLFGIATLLGEIFYGHKIIKLTSSIRKNTSDESELDLLFAEYIYNRGSSLLFSKNFKKVPLDQVLAVESILVNPQQLPTISSIERHFNYLASLEPKCQHKVKKFIAEIKALDFTTRLLKEMYAADKALAEFHTTPESWDFMVDLENGSLEEENKLIESLYEKFPFFRDLGKQIEQLLNLLNIPK